MSSAGATAKLHPSAILFGLIVDVLGSGLAGLAVILAFGVEPGDSAAVEQLTTTTVYYAVSLPLGLLFTAIGGGVAAHLSVGEELNNAFVMGVASAVTSLIFSVGSALPLWYLAASILLTVPAALAGGYVRARTRA